MSLINSKSITNGEVKISPIPKQPDLSEYEHLSEKERMSQGYPYKPWDPELGECRLRARQLLRKFNDLPPELEPERKKVLKELLHPDTADDLYIEPTFRCDYGYNITFGKGVQINYDCCILDCAPVKIGNNALFAPCVHIYAATHPLCPVERLQFELAKPVTIGDNVWVGGMSVICPGVTIGDNVTIGAGSVVVKDVPSNVVVAGNPAKIIRYLPGYKEN